MGSHGLDVLISSYWSYGPILALLALLCDPFLPQLNLQLCIQVHLDLDQVYASFPNHIMTYKPFKALAMPVTCYFQMLTFLPCLFVDMVECELPKIILVTTHGKLLMSTCLPCILSYAHARYKCFCNALFTLCL